MFSLDILLKRDNIVSLNSRMLEFWTLQHYIHYLSSSSERRDLLEWVPSAFTVCALSGKILCLPPEATHKWIGGAVCPASLAIFG